ncbi:MAG: CHAT domain-containing protein, partial [Ignavibacteriae bacterium]|nr:CHAT domain-containing protein [Ignavibacteriota bacterium]
MSYLYRILGNNDRAAEEIEQALFIFQSKLGDDNPMVIVCQFEQASVYISQGKMLAAEAILYRIQEIQKQNEGENSTQYALTLYNLANLYIRTYNHKSADSLISKAMTIVENKMGKSVPFYSDCLNSLGIVKWVLDDLDEAKDLLEEAVFWRKNLFGDKNPLYASTISNLAGVYKDLDKMNKAEQLYKESQTLLLMQIDKYFPFMSEAERLNFNRTLKERLDMFNCFAVKRREEEPGILVDVYNQRLATKALLLRTSRNIREKIIKIGNQAILNKFDNWKKIKEELAVLYSLSKKQLNLMEKNADSLEDAANELEKELSSVIIDIGDKNKIDWTDIQKSLKSDEAAIEIIRVEYFDKGWTDDAFYGALILTKETKDNPLFVILPHANSLDSMYLFYYKRSIMNRISDDESYNYFWKSIDEKIEGKDVVYLSTDGIYNNINLNTLKKPDGTYVIDEKKIKYVSTTSDIIKDDKKLSKKYLMKDACLIGNPKFSKNEQPNDELSPVREVNIVNYDIINEKNIIPVAPLPGTEKEVFKIDSLLEEKKWQIEYLTGEEASENNLKSLNSPSILHIATHGFFLGDEILKKHEKVFGVRIDKAMSDPLLRSGLLLAGAGEALNSQDFSYSADNGIFTAYEALNLNLENTNLVVLSACETGLGKVLKGEGVYGLQRAFQIAGAEDVIMSLWVVNDIVTQELMTKFYRYWLSGINIDKAFR